MQWNLLITGTFGTGILGTWDVDEQATPLNHTVESIEGCGYREVKSVILCRQVQNPLHEGLDRLSWCHWVYASHKASHSVTPWICPWKLEHKSFICGSMCVLLCISSHIVINVQRNFQKQTSFGVRKNKDSVECISYLHIQDFVSVFLTQVSTSRGLKGVGNKIFFPSKRMKLKIKSKQPSCLCIIYYYIDHAWVNSVLTFDLSSDFSVKPVDISI